MKATFAIVTTILLLAGSATAQPAPAGPPPVFKVVHGSDNEKGQITLLETMTKAVPVQKVVFKTVAVVENGMNVSKTFKEIVTEHVTVEEQRTVMIDATRSRVITPDGKQLPIDEVWKRLKKDTVVLVSSDGNTPAQVYLRALNAETLIVIAPQMDRIVVPPGVTPIEPKKLEPPPAPRGR
jgi:hypothetical protein